MSNVEVVDDQDGDVVVSAAFVLHESRIRGLTPWVGRLRYRLRRGDDGELRMAAKTVLLVDNDQPLHTLAFLIS